METNNNQLIAVEGEVTLNSIEMSADERKKMCKDIVAVQEKVFIPVEQDEFDEDTKSIEVYTEIQNTKKSGAFIPVNGLTLLSVGNDGTKIFSKRIAKGGGFGDPVLIFVYPDGSVSEDVEIKMYELLEIAGGNYGDNCESIDKSDIAEAKKLIKKIAGRVLSYWTGDIGIRIKDLLRILVENLSTLQVDRGNELDIDKVYAAIFKYVEKVSGYPSKCYVKRKSVYALQREDMEEVANSLGAKINEIVNIVKRHNLLHLQPSSIGYQCEVKDVGSCYCIKVLSNYKHENYVDFNFDPNERL